MGVDHSGKQAEALVPRAPRDARRCTCVSALCLVCPSALPRAPGLRALGTYRNLGPISGGYRWASPCGTEPGISGARLSYGSCGSGPGGGPGGGEVHLEARTGAHLPWLTLR
ncbi:unnamed protein product [Eretmochelys imbricata]